MTTRRSVLKALGFTPVAAPLAAKAATDKAIGDLAGISNAVSPLPFVGLGGPIPESLDQVNWKKKVLRFLMNPKLPAWFEDDLRDRCRYVGYLDPDIACKRSWSMSVKIATQKQRNIERVRRDAIEGPKRGLRAREFEEKYGIWL